MQKNPGAYRKVTISRVNPKGLYIKLYACHSKKQYESEALTMDESIIMERLERLEEESRLIKTDLKEQGERLNEVEHVTAVLDVKWMNITDTLKEIKDSINKLNEKIDSIERRPAKKWDDAMKTVVTVVITTIVTYLFAQILR